MKSFVRRVAFSSVLFCVSAHAQASTVMDVEVTCPIGGQRFMTQVVGSGTAFGHHLDRRPFGAIASPWPIAKCPGNGFVVYKDDIAEEELTALTAFVLSTPYQALQKKESNYYLAATLLRRDGAPALTLAEALLKATWEVEGDARYPRYAAEALAVFEAVIAAPPGSLDAGQLAFFEQLAGEMERRLGRFDAAQRRFEALLATPGVPGTSLEPVVRQELALIAAKDSDSHPVAEAP